MVKKKAKQTCGWKANVGGEKQTCGWKPGCCLESNPM